MNKIYLALASVGCVAATPLFAQTASPSSPAAQPPATNQSPPGLVLRVAPTGCDSRNERLPRHVYTAYRTPREMAPDALFAMLEERGYRALNCAEAMRFLGEPAYRNHPEARRAILPAVVFNRREVVYLQYDENSPAQFFGVDRIPAGTTVLIIGQE